MRTKGFTLIELLAVIVILSIILVIAVPGILGVIEKTKENVYKLNEDLIRKATETYIESGKVDITGTSAVVKLDDLISNGFIDPIKDPKDKLTGCDGYVEVTINSNSPNTYTPYLSCGDNYTTVGYVDPDAPRYTNSNIHDTSIPNGYTAIYKVEDLNNVRNNLSGSYILMNNLDFNSDSSYTNPANKTAYTAGTGWNPISTFTGVFNGNGYTIGNLYINRPASSQVGLFGILGNPGVVEKIGLVDVNITASSQIGGIAGYKSSNSIVRNTYVTGNIIGSSNYVGGIAGRVSDGATTGNILNSYSTANVTGASYVGGLAGYIYYTSITNCYSTGNVTATGAGAYYGRLIGYYDWVNYLTNSLYSSDSTVTGTGTLDTHGEATPLVILKTQLYTKYKLGWDIDNIWYSDDVNYPIFGGTSGDKITAQTNIGKIEDLFLVTFNLGSSYTLLNDLDFNNSNDYRNPVFKDFFTKNQGWIPIGNGNNFTGVFNGNGHVIKNLFSNRTGICLGLFGTIYGGTVEKLGLENVDVTGSYYTGGLSGNLGISTSTIRNVYVTGKVTSTGSFAGGLFGYGYSGNISNSYSRATISGVTYAGGLAGLLSYGSITNSYATGNVTVSGSSAYYGVLIGYKDTFATVTNSYFSSDATLTGTATLSTQGEATPLNVLKTQIYTKYKLGWDIDNIWNAADNQYPVLGSTSGTQVAVTNSISKIDDLFLINFSLSGSYTLANDLDFNNVNDYRNSVFKDFFTTNKGWIPIGISNNFTGTFNGNGHVIKNLFINNTNGLAGLFATPSGATIEKLGLENVNVTGSSYSGGLAGSVGISTSTIRNIYVTGNVTSTNSYAGGLYGYGYSCNLSNSYSTANITGLTYVGGLAGMMSYGSITNCFATGSVTATQASGANFGRLLGTSISTTNSYYNGTSTLTGTGTICTTGTSSTAANIQPLTLTGLNTWDTTNIWKVNSGAYPTFK